MKFYPHILDHRQKIALEKLTFFDEFGLYLAGGTGLALQLGHRTSLGFDFYSEQKFESKKLTILFKQSFSPLEIFQQNDDTFQITAHDINISVFYYPYQLLNTLVEFPPIELASLEDIAAMKVVAIVQRAKQRDFWDIYYLVETLGIEKVIASAYRKYPWYKENNQIVFKALTYFEEADNDQEVDRVTVFDKKLGWTEVKKKIKDEVQKFFVAS